MLPCPAGTYSPGSSDSCFACRKGRVCLNPSMTEEQYLVAYCPPGKVCTGLDNTPVDCPLGSFCFGSSKEPFAVS
jgi:hypothetical protein